MLAWSYSALGNCSGSLVVSAGVGMQEFHCSAQAYRDCKLDCCSSTGAAQQSGRQAAAQPTQAARRLSTRTDIKGADAGLGALQQVGAPLQRHLAALQGGGRAVWAVSGLPEEVRSW